MVTSSDLRIQRGLFLFSCLTTCKEQLSMAWEFSYSECHVGVSDCMPTKLPPLTQILNSVKQPQGLCLKTSKPVTRQAAPTRARPPSPSLAQDRCAVKFRQGYPECWHFCVVCDSQSTERLYGMMSGKQFKAVSTHPPSVLVFFFFSSFSFSFVRTYNLFRACYSALLR